MKNDCGISPKSGSSRFSTFNHTQSSRSQLFLALAIIAAIFLSSCVKERPNDQITYDTRTRPESGKMVANSNMASGTMAPSATPVPGEADEAQFNTEGYSHIDENPFLDVGHAPLSTFS